MNTELETFEALCWAKVHGELPAAREPEFTTGLATIPGAPGCLAGIEALHKHLLAAAATTNSEAGEDALTDALLRQIEVDRPIHATTRTDGIGHGVILLPPVPGEASERELPPVGSVEASDCHPLAPASGEAPTTGGEGTKTIASSWMSNLGFLGIVALAAALLLLLVSVAPQRATVEYKRSKARSHGPAPSTMDPEIRAACDEFDKLFLPAVDPDPSRVFVQISDESARIDITQGDEVISQRFTLSNIPTMVETFVQDHFSPGE